MAKIFYELRKNNNDETLAFGKYYAFAITRGDLTP